MNTCFHICTNYFYEIDRFFPGKGEKAYQALTFSKHFPCFKQNEASKYYKENTIFFLITVRIPNNRKYGVIYDIYTFRHNNLSNKLALNSK